VSLINDINAEPWRFDFFSVLRRIERSYPDRPRIGDSAARREEYLVLGQDPYMDFPASNLSAFERGADESRYHSVTWSFGIRYGGTARSE